MASMVIVCSFSFESRTVLWMKVATAKTAVDRTNDIHHDGFLTRGPGRHSVLWVWCIDSIRAVSLYLSERSIIDIETHEKSKQELRSGVFCGAAVSIENRLPEVCLRLTLPKRNAHNLRGSAPAAPGRPRPGAPMSWSPLARLISAKASASCPYCGASWRRRGCS
jgi:hypothetical protein